MKGQKAQRGDYRKCYKRERDQDEYEECENNHNSIKNLGQME